MIILNLVSVSFYVVNVVWNWRRPRTSTQITDILCSCIRESEISTKYCRAKTLSGFDVSAKVGNLHYNPRFLCKRKRASPGVAQAISAPIQEMSCSLCMFQCEEMYFQDDLWPSGSLVYRCTDLED